MLTITVLVENSDGKDLCGEHGLSLFIEYNGGKYLLDMGATELFAKNAARLGLSLADVDAAFLSHAHYDHAGGLSRFFAENPSAKVHLQEAAAENCYSERAGAREYIGMPRGILREHADRFCFVPGAPADTGNAARDDSPAGTSVAPGVWILPHTTPNLEEQGRKAHMYQLEHGSYQPDDFSHEQSVIFETEHGLILCNSCSPVSYTHLDVYKRQSVDCRSLPMVRSYSVLPSIWMSFFTVSETTITRPSSLWL